MKVFPEENYFEISIVLISCVEVESLFRETMFEHYSYHTDSIVSSFGT